MPFVHRKPWRVATSVDGIDYQDARAVTGCCVGCEKQPPCRPAETRGDDGVYVVYYRFYPWLRYNLSVALSSCSAKDSLACATILNGTHCRTAGSGSSCAWDGSSCTAAAAADCLGYGSLGLGKAMCESTAQCSYRETELGYGGTSALNTMPAERPVGIHAQFDDSLVRINVDFNIDTNYARTVGQQSDCGNIFGHDQVFTWLLNGEAGPGGAKCTWKSPTSLRIALGYMSKVTTTEAAGFALEANGAVYNAEFSAPGYLSADGTGIWNGNMSLASGKEDAANVPSWAGEAYPLTSLEENSKLCTDSLAIKGPDTPLIPVARIDAPIQVGLCEAVVVKGSNSYGGGPRPLSYLWTALTQADQPMPTLNMAVASIDAGASTITLGTLDHTVVSGQQMQLQDAPERICGATPKGEALTVGSASGAMLSFVPTCTGTAVDGQTNCAALFSAQAGTSESDCASGSGIDCVYTSGIATNDPNAAENCVVGYTLSTYLHSLNMQVGQAGTMGQSGLTLSRNDTVAGARYNFHLQVMNFLGETAEDVVEVRKLNVSVPNVEIMAGDRRDVLRSASVLLQGTAALPQADCVPPSWRVMAYYWSQVENGAPTLTLTDQTRRNKDLYLPPETLSTYYTFEFKLEAWPSVAPDAKNFASAWVSVLPEDLVADIAGGSNRIVGSDSPVTLDGSTSRDLCDVPTSMTYEWSCEMPYKKPRLLCTSARLTGSAATCPMGCLYTSLVTAAAATCEPVDARACAEAVMNGTEMSCTSIGSCVYTPADDAQGISEACCVGVDAATCSAVDVNSVGAADACTASSACSFSDQVLPVDEACSYPQFLNVSVGPCVDNTNQLLNFTSAAIQTIPAEVLHYESGAGLGQTFTVTVAKESNVSGIYDRRNATAVTLLYVVPGDPPQVSIGSPPQAKVNAQKRLVLQGTILSKRPHTIGYNELNEAYPTKWSVVAGLLDLKDPAATTTGQFGQDYTPSVNLVITAGSLVPGQEYRLRLDAQDEYGAGYAISSFIVNTAPASGALFVEPLVGTALNTTFIATMDGWADDPVDLPLVYRFSYLLAGKESNIGNFAEVSYADMILPTGDDQNGTVDYHVVIVGYVADRFGASAREEFTVSVRAPNITMDAVDSFAEDAMDSVCDLALELGYAEKASACLGAAMNVVNQVPVEARRRRHLAEGGESEADASVAPIRERFVDSMVSAGAGTTPTDVNTQTNLDLAASATTATDELSKNATSKSLDFVGGIVSARAGGLDTAAGSTTTTVLSNILSSSVKTAASATNMTESNDPADRQSIVLADDSDQDSQPCPNDCSGHGRCIMGECLCDTYECTLGHCIREVFPRNPEVAYVVEDECTNTTCHRYTCSRGMCKPFVTDCHEGSCSNGVDGEVRCFRGSCSTILEHYALPDCAVTPGAKLATELQQRRDDKALSDKLSGAVKGLGSAVLSDRVSGEESVDFETPMIKSKSLRASATALSDPSGFSTPAADGGASASFSIPQSLFAAKTNSTGGLNCTTSADCSEPRGSCVFPDANATSLANGTCVCEAQYTGPDCAEDAVSQADVDMKATQYGTNIYGFSGTSEGIKSTITSIELSVGTDSSPEPFVIGIPTSPPAEVGGSACTADENCTAPQGYCAAEGVCACNGPYTGADCSDIAVCKFWDTAEERFSSEGCTVAAVEPTVTTCNCTHLTDFASFEEEWLPQMNVVNPFDPALLAAFMADPRNIVVLILLVTLYSMWIVGTVYGYKKDQADRHQLYMQDIAVTFGGNVDQWSGTTPTKTPIVLPEDNDVEEQRMQKEAEDKEKRRMKRRQRKLEKRLLELKQSRDAADRDPEMLTALREEIEDLKDANRNAEQGNVCVRQARRFCGWCKGLGPAMTDGIAEAHPWASVIFVNADDRFTRPQRAAVLFCVIFGTIALGAFLMEGPRCMPEDPGYPNCVGWQGCYEECQDEGDGEDAERRLQDLLTNATNASSAEEAEDGPPCGEDPEEVQCSFCISMCLSEAEAEEGEEEEAEEMEEGAWKKIITTACIVSVLMLPADRLFVTMFETVTDEAGDAHANGAGGRAWALPDLQDANKDAVMKIQAAFRGRLARKRQHLLQKKKAERERGKATVGDAGGGGSFTPATPATASATDDASPAEDGLAMPGASAPARGPDEELLPGVPEGSAAVPVPASGQSIAQIMSVAGGDTLALSSAPGGDTLALSSAPGEPPGMPRGAVEGPSRRRMAQKMKPKALAGLTVAHQSTRHGLMQKMGSQVMAATPEPGAPGPTYSSQRGDIGEFDDIMNAPPGGPPGGPPPKAGRKRPMPSALSRSRPSVHGNFEIQETELTSLDEWKTQEHALIVMQASWRGMLVRRKLRAEWEDEERRKANRRARIRHRIRIAGQVALATTGKERAIKRGRKRRRLQKQQEGEEEEEDEGFPRWFMGVTYAACVVWCLMCGLYTLAICVYFGPVASLEWLLCCCSASCFEAFVQDPLKIAIVVILGDQAEFLVDVYLECMDYMPFQL